MSTVNEKSTGETGRRLSRQQRAEQILAATDSLLTERGFDQVSMRDIAERAGMKKALVFYYFASREELFERVLERYSEAHATALARARGLEGSLLERLTGLLSCYLDFVEAHPTFARLVMQEVSRHGESQTPQIRNSLQALLGTFEHVLGGSLPKAGPEATRHFFTTLMSAMCDYPSYARVLGDLLTTSVTEDDRRERRAHILWLGEAMVGKLTASR